MRKIWMFLLTPLKIVVILLYGLLREVWLDETGHRSLDRKVKQNVS
jgi:hypothetical protein